MPDTEEYTMEPDDVVAMMEDPEFWKEPFEKRQSISERALADAGKSLQPKMDKETFKQWGAFTGKIRQKIADSETAAEKAAWGVKTAGGAVKDALAITGMNVMGMSPFLPDENGKWGLRQVPGQTIVPMIGANLASLATGQVQKLTHDKKPLTDALADVKESLDEGEFFDHPKGLEGWLDDASKHLETTQSALYKDEGWAKQNSLLGRSDNVQALHAYLRTRDPSAWELLTTNMLQTPGMHRFEEEKKSLMNDTALGKSAKGAEAKGLIAEAGDPLEVAGNLMTAGAGNAAMKTGMSLTKRAGKLALGVGAEMLSEQVSAMIDNPDLSWDQRVKIAKESLLAGMGLTAAGAAPRAVGSLVSKFNGATPGEQTAAAVPGTQPNTDPNSMAAIAARAGTQDIDWQQSQPAPATIGGRPVLLAQTPDGASTLTPPAQAQETPSAGQETPAGRQPILSSVPDAPTPIKVGENVSYEGYTGQLVADGVRYAVQVPNGPLIEIADAAAVSRAAAPAAVVPGASPTAPALPDPQVNEATFTAAADGSLAIQTADGQTYVPHNPQLLRTVRKGPDGLEVLVRKPDEPGRIIKLVGAQAKSAEDAFLNAAGNVEAAGGKVNWGTAKQRLQFSGAGSRAVDFVTNLGKAIAGKLPSNAVLDLGTPGDTLTKAGVPNLPLRVRQRVMRRKTAKHDELTAAVLQGLPAAIQKPMAVYVSPGDSKAHAIVTTIDTPSGPITGYFTVREDQGGNQVLDTKTIFGKNPAEILAELQSAQQSGDVGHLDKGAFDTWVATQARGDLAATSHQHSQAIEGLNEFFAQAEPKIKPRLQESLAGQFSRVSGPVLRKAVQEARSMIEERIPGLITPKVHIVTTLQELLDSGLINPAELSADENANLQTAEAFFDNATGNTVIIADQVTIRPGESPRSAIARVLLHERIGHEGVNALIQQDPSFADKWNKLAEAIPAAELDAIAAEDGYAHIASDRAQLALEWLARKVEEVEGGRNAAAMSPGALGIARQMWQALMELMTKAFSGFSNKAAFEHDIGQLITQARDAVLNGTSDPVTPTALAQRLNFKLGGSKIVHRAGEPYRVNNRAWRSILTGSPLPSSFVETVAATDRERKTLNQTAAQLGADLEAAAKAHAEASGVPISQVYDLLNQAMSGAPGTNAVLLQTAPALAERARRARNFVDDLSQAIASTLPVGTLRNSIMLNQGAWMKRSYAAFDPASGWNYDAVMSAAAEGRDIAGRSARDIVAKAMRFLRSQTPNATRAEIEATMRDLMDRDTWAGYLSGKAAVRKDVSSLIERAEIPVEIRDLMGEEHNPVKRFAQSTSFQSQFLHRHQGQTALRQIGLSNGLFRTQRGGVYTTEIPHDNPRWSPLAGIWTTPQLWQALQDLEGVTAGTDLGAKALDALKWMGTEAKFNRVAANPDSWLVNMLGNVVALVQTGDVFYSSIFRRVGDAVALHRAGRPKAADVVNVAAEAVTDAQRALVARLTASGVIGETFTLRDLEASLPRHLLQWVANDQRPDRILGGVKGALWGQAAFRGLGIPGRVVGGAIGGAVGAMQGYAKLQGYQQTLANYVMTGPDAIARLTGFLGNYETALAAGMQPDEAFTHASQRTRNTFPDYGALPGLMKTLSRYGVMGSFIGFQYEVYRNAIWNIRYAAQDLRSANPALVRKGLARSAGASIVGVLAAGGMQAIFQGLAGTDDERNKKWRRWFAAPWEKNGVIVFTKYTPEGVSYFNTSYLIPQATIMELVNAATSGRDPGEAAANLTAAVWEQFMGSSVHVGPIMAALTNVDRMGRQITNKDGLAGIAERVDELSKSIEPGWAAKMERIEYALRGAEKNGRLYSLEEEGKRFVGIREFTRTWPDMVKRAYDVLQARNSSIRAQANKTLGLNLPGAPVKAIEDANAAIEQLAKDTADFEADLEVLGVPANIVRAARRDSSIPRKFSKVEIDPDAKNRVRSSH